MCAILRTKSRTKTPPKIQKELEHNAAASQRASPLLKASMHRRKQFTKQPRSWAEIQRTALRNLPSATKFPPASLSPKLLNTRIKPNSRREVMRTSDEIQLYPPSSPQHHPAMSLRLSLQQKEEKLFVALACPHCIKTCCLQI